MMDSLHCISHDKATAISGTRREQCINLSPQTEPSVQGMDRNQLFELQNAAACNLALWSNSAWFDADQSSLSRTAIGLWVVNHRASVAERNITVAQIIGGVRGVIPNSKLAKYGNYRYDEKSEEMYLTVDDYKDQTGKSEVDFTASQWSINNFFGADLPDTKSENLDDAIHFKSNAIKKNVKQVLEDASLNQWLKKIRNILFSVKRTVGDSILDSWTDILLKTSLRFVYAIKTNTSLEKVMNSEIRFITDYKQLLSEPVSRLELQSIPQPSTEETNLDSDSADLEWLKLSSSQIRKIWKQKSKHKLHHADEQDKKNEEIYSLMQINFLRRLKGKKLNIQSEKIEISKDTALQLLGSSLLQAINDCSVESNKIYSNQVPIPIESKSTKENFFPEAHGEWTKDLFPHKTELFQLPNKEPTPCRPVFCVPQISSNCPPIRPEQICKKNIPLPMRYYMSIPPPPLQSGMCVPPPRQPYMCCQQRNGIVLVPSNKLPINQMPQQVPFRIPTAPPRYIPPPVPPPAYSSIPPPRPNWNNAIRLNVPVPAATAALQYTRLNVPKMVYQPIPRELIHQKYDIDSSSDSSILQNETMSGRNDKCTSESIEKKSTIWMPYKNLVYPSSYSDSGYPIRFLQRSSTINPLIQEKNMQPQIPIYNNKSNPIQPLHDTTLPMKGNPTVNFKFSAPVLRHVAPPKPPVFLQNYSVKPMFVSAATYNNVKRMQNRIFVKKYKEGDVCEINNQDVHKPFSIECLPLPGKDDNLNYEDKVEKWLETINQYTKCNIFPELPHDDSKEITSKERNISLILEKCGKNNSLLSSEIEYDSKNAFTQNQDQPRRKLYGITKKLKKKCLREIYLKYLLSFKNSVFKLKKTRSVENKVEILKHFISEIKLKCNGHQFKRNKPKNHKILRRAAKKRQNTVAIKQNLTTMEKTLDMKPIKQKHTAEDYIKKIQDTMQSTDITSRISYQACEFNTFPSKRFKLSNPTSMFSSKEPAELNQVSKGFSGANYLDIVADELIFSNPNLDAAEKKTSSSNFPDYEFASGWDHFKLVLKIILRNVALSLDGQRLHGASRTQLCIK